MCMYLAFQKTKKPKNMIEGIYNNTLAHSYFWNMMNQTHPAVG